MKTIIRGILIMILAGLAVFGFAGCAKEKGQDADNKNLFEQITPKQAKDLMDNETGLIILDVRTDSEYAEGHIKNAVLIPDYEIQDRAEKELKDKNQLILVYCRSGRRSKAAAQTLAGLGYTNVKDFGGIINWPYEIVK